jgi:hypothetical protein
LLVQIPVPQHRMTPLKNAWMQLYQPVTEHLKLDMRMNLKAKKVEIKNSPATTDIGHLQKAADFVQAFLLGVQPLTYKPQHSAGSIPGSALRKSVSISGREYFVQAGREDLPMHVPFICSV